MAQKTPKTKTITSRSFTLTTNKFCLDFSWRKVEIEEEVSPLRDKSVLYPADPRENFASVLHRKQITNLTAPACENISPYRTLPIALTPLGQPAGRQVVRNYRQANLTEPDPDTDDYV